jgi:tRNA1(Val) A37 N6-methylase TrmN6
MDTVLNSTPANKESAFRDYLLARNPSESFARKYLTYMHSSLIRRLAHRIAKVGGIYQVNNIDLLQDIYEVLKKEPDNVRLHNVYSGVLSAYMKFLTGKELRKRVIKKED